MYRIRANQIVEDIRSGMTDDQLRKKYGLSLRGLQRALKTLTLENAVSHSEMCERSNAYRSITEVLSSRNAPRIYVPIAIRIYNVQNNQRGFVRDVSGEGLRLAGISATPGETLFLKMPLKELMRTSAVEFQAKCKWAKKEGRIKKYTVCGLRIISMSPESRAGFNELLDLFKRRENGMEQPFHSPLDLPELVKSAKAMNKEVEGPRFSGQVEGIDILEFVQFLMLSGKKTRLDVSDSNGDECQIHFSDGRIIQASYGEKQGVEAFFQCMNLIEGQFSARPFDEPVEETIEEPGDFLIFEAARRRDLNSGSMGGQ
jgi:hypothetical protein